MQKPTWFDGSYEKKLKTATAAEAMAMIAEDKKVLASLSATLKDYDEHAGKPHWYGPSRSQVVRTSIAQALNAD